MLSGVTPRSSLRTLCQGWNLVLLSVERVLSPWNRSWGFRVKPIVNGGVIAVGLGTFEARDRGLVSPGLGSKVSCIRVPWG